MLGAWHQQRVTWRHHRGGLSAGVQHQQRAPHLVASGAPFNSIIKIELLVQNFFSAFARAASFRNFCGFGSPSLCCKSSLRVRLNGFPTLRFTSRTSSVQLGVLRHKTLDISQLVNPHRSLAKMIPRLQILFH